MSTFSYNYSSIIFIKGSTSLGFPLQVQLRLDTLSFLFLTLVTFLIPILLLISIKNIKKNIKFYLILILGIADAPLYYNHKLFGRISGVKDETVTSAGFTNATPQRLVLFIDRVTG